MHSATPGDIWKSAGNPRSVASQNQLEVSDGGDVNDLDDDGGEDKCVDNDEKIGCQLCFCLTFRSDLFGFPSGPFQRLRLLVFV